MSLYGVMRTSTSGMAAQANRLATVADNIANVNTTGYKRAHCEFSSLLIEQCPVGYVSGSVETDVRRAIGEQGTLLSTTSTTDLAIRGDGFFIVTDASGSPYLTRAGSFVPNGDGELVNAGGFTLMGYRIDPTLPPPVVNGFAGLEAVNLSALALVATPSSAGEFSANLPSNDPVATAGNLPSDNTASPEYSGKSSLVCYDNLGNEVILDLYFAKTAANDWELAVYNRADATPATNGFPYASGPLVTSALSFDGTTGQLTGGGSITVPVPNGAAMTVDMSAMSQLATGYTVLGAQLNGNPPSGVDVVEFSSDGTMFVTYENGSRVPVYQIPLAFVTSPDKMFALAGNVFSPSSDSGDVQVGFAETAGLGSIVSASLEQSTVDLASELTTMIDSQRSYAANSKVFQTGSELMEVLINLKR